MKIHELMNPKVETSFADALLSDAAARMQTREIGFLPITNPITGALDGVVTDRDILMTALKHKKPLTEIRVGEAMTPSVRSCPIDAEVSTAHALMREHHIRRLPVTDPTGRLVGVLSLDDLARAASGKRLSHARADVAETLGTVGRSHITT